ncbi:MAG: tetratricopeptide repeat protein [Alphaproteobacteria bacterium]
MELQSPLDFQPVVSWFGSCPRRRYALGDFTGAVRAFREATRIHPRAAPAFNNLAHVLAEAGRRKEAEAAARSAVALAGPLTHLYRATLATILAEKR